MYKLKCPILWYKYDTVNQNDEYSNTSCLRPFCVNEFFCLYKRHKTQMFKVPIVWSTFNFWTLIEGCPFRRMTVKMRLYCTRFSTFSSQEVYLSLATNTLELSLTLILILIHDVHYIAVYRYSSWWSRTFLDK